LNDRWVPKENIETPLGGISENLYAVLGPEFSRIFVEAVETSSQSDILEIREIVASLKEMIGRPPAALVHMGASLAGLETAMRHRHHDAEEPGVHDAVLDRLGWESLKFFGSSYVHMFQRFGFSEETLRHYLQNCVGFGERFDWPPPGVAYKYTSQGSGNDEKP
jgi:hypothetical protein